MNPRLLRWAHSAVRVLAPGRTGRWVTDVFSSTRTLGDPPADVLPLGARSFPIEGCPSVERGYLWGEGPPTALLVHGWGADSSSMQPLVQPLRAMGFTVAAFDAPAHGVSPGRHATMTQYSEAISAVLRAINGADVVVAHSLGSIAAVSALGQQPSSDRSPRCVVLLAPTCTLSGVLDRWRPAAPALRPSDRARVRAELHRRNGVPITHWDVSVLGARLPCPMLALHDPDDPVVPYSEAASIAASLPDVRLLPVPGRGHAGLLAAPDVAAEVSAFIARAMATRAAAS